MLYKNVGATRMLRASSLSLLPTRLVKISVEMRLKAAARGHARHKNWKWIHK